MTKIYSFNRFYALLLTALMIFFCAEPKAQYRNIPELSSEVMAWTVSIMEPWPEGRYKSLKEAMIDNDFFIPAVFRGIIFNMPDLSYNLDTALFPETKIPPLFDYKSKTMDNMFGEYLFRKHLADMVYNKVLLNNPHNFKYTRSQLPEKSIRPRSINKSNKDIDLRVKTAPAAPETVDPVLKFIPDRKYWVSAFSADIKFSQNKTTSNWHKGEIDNMNIFTYTSMSYNYARGNISLTNTLTTNFTISNAPKDTLRNYAIGTDELRLKSIFGLKAIKNWDYSLSAELITAMGTKHITNTKNVNAAFLSPYTINLGGGLTYNLNPKFQSKDRSLSLKLTIEPISLKYMYSINEDINLGAYFPKREDGTYRRSLTTFGPSATMNSSVKFNKNVSLTSRLYYFTNYEKVNCEYENKMDIILSRYFSTTLYLYLRFDDGVAKNEKSNSYLQLNEQFSFGFSYKW